MDSRNHNSPPRWKLNKWTWFGVCATLIGLAASWVVSMTENEAILCVAAGLSWLSYVGFFVSLSNLHRAPRLLGLTALIGLLGTIAASDIYVSLFRALSNR